jgi:short-subunit dehydrogenase
VARREHLLAQLRDELAGRHGIAVEVVAMDLAERDAPQRLYDRLDQAGTRVDVLVNNAGFGLYGPFLDLPWERQRAMLELDIVALVHLTKLFLPPMVQRRNGYLLHVASIGAYAPSPGYAAYSAAKAFVLSFGEALNHELRGTGVSSTVVAPGVAATEFLAVSGQQPTVYQRAVMMPSRDVARIGIHHMLKRTPSVVPGRANSILAWSTRLLPRRLNTAIAAALMQQR